MGSASAKTAGADAGGPTELPKPLGSPAAPSRAEQEEMMLSVVTRRHCQRDFATYRNGVLFHSGADMHHPSAADAVAAKCAGVERRWLKCCEAEMKDPVNMEAIRYDVFASPQCRPERLVLEQCVQRLGGGAEPAVVPSAKGSKLPPPPTPDGCVAAREAAMLCGLAHLAAAADAELYGGGPSRRQ